MRFVCLALAVFFGWLAAAAGVLWVRNWTHSDVIHFDRGTAGGSLALRSLGGRLFLHVEDAPARPWGLWFESEPIGTDLYWTEMDERTSAVAGFGVFDLTQGYFVSWMLFVPGWFPMLLFAAGCALFLWLRAVFVRRLIPPGHCRRCGYDLRSSPARCPECGTKPQENPPAAPGLKSHSEPADPAARPSGCA